ncbi:hypothetical protein PHLCEN_2v1 [Hermanssonia centrifuga]|uniref:F-box domain-containing protein n=1 Tax=Hermanssonia centrifuga TaxID=98765 RepID=A0A2R6S764_9APHY|nr:hypothetical protein PHLCEN_2v1 [Hermanssonia centrifuga]
MDALPVELLCTMFPLVSKEDLAACSSVSRLWRQITLPLLFERLDIIYARGIVEEEEILSQGRFLIFLLNETDGDDPSTPSRLAQESISYMAFFILSLSQTEARHCCFCAVALPHTVRGVMARAGYDIDPPRDDCWKWSV